MATTTTTTTDAQNTTTTTVEPQGEIRFDKNAKANVLGENEKSQEDSVEDAKRDALRNSDAEMPNRDTDRA